VTVKGSNRDRREGGTVCRAVVKEGGRQKAASRHDRVFGQTRNSVLDRQEISRRVERNGSVKSGHWGERDLGKSEHRRGRRAARSLLEREKERKVWERGRGLFGRVSRYKRKKEKRNHKKDDGDPESKLCSSNGKVGGKERQGTMKWVKKKGENEANAATAWVAKHV